MNFFQVDMFLDKNRDNMRPELLDLLVASKSNVSLLKSVYTYLFSDLQVQCEPYLECLTFSNARLVLCTVKLHFDSLT